MLAYDEVAAVCIYAGLGVDALGVSCAFAFAHDAGVGVCEVVALATFGGYFFGTFRGFELWFFRFFACLFFGFFRLL